MESTVSRREARGCLHHRALSQASTGSSMMHSPKTTKSTSTSSSHPRAITPSSASHPLRVHHNQWDGETTGTRQAPRLSREASAESKRPMTPVSALLQERLQQERRAQSERLASKLGTDPSSSTGDIRDADLSDASGQRHKLTTDRGPRSSHDDDSSQNNMGAKQVEKAVSELHKQNFDLKLELFHRREKQSVLEMRVEELEDEQRAWMSERQNLLGEIATRDKAIEEAVDMIVQLEARVNDLVWERGVLRQPDVQAPFQRGQSAASDPPSAKTREPSDPSALSPIVPRALDRMPSFLSDRSAHTEHLRSVVLQKHSSSIHLRKVSQVSSSSADFSEINRRASPSLSMLSESSFMSIYGSKQGHDAADLPPPDHVSGMDGTFGGRSPTPTMSTVRSASMQSHTAPGYAPNPASRPATSLSIRGQGMPVNVALRRGPLQNLERLGERADLVGSMLRPSTSVRRRSVVAPASQSVKSPPQAGGTRERRQTLDKVVTNHPTHKELANAHALPPTPDTVSSSTLRKHQDLSGSEDSLRASDDARAARLVTTSLPHGTDYLRSLASQEGRHSTSPQKVSSSAPVRHNPSLPNPGLVGLERDLPADPGHSARPESTAIRRPRSDSFVSDSDSDGGADAHSETDSFDYWMRESYKPVRDNARFNPHRDREHCPSPDLFSFPGNDEGWQPDAIFGALEGRGFLGSPVPGLKRDPVDEVSHSFQPPPPGASGLTANGPQPPSRNSSLNAQAASYLPPPPSTEMAGRGASQEGGVLVAGARGRSNSVDATGARVDAGSSSKRSHYPPISGLQMWGRGLAINSLFRKPGADNYGAPSSAIESGFPVSTPQRGPPQAHSHYSKQPSGRSSVPPPATIPWAARPIDTGVYTGEDEPASATPPPIMRNRPPPPQTELASPDTAVLDSAQAIEAGEYEANSPATVDATMPVSAQGSGGVRKWLGLGRRTSLKNRAG